MGETQSKDSRLLSGTSNLKLEMLIKQKQKPYLKIKQKLKIKNTGDAIFLENKIRSNFDIGLDI